ncbi:uncharacterized protein LOC127736654 [Mytilus californianus]|uniref:uncharacterized protein LOC127736654 n=1 Tax=Mytilus californianus TaxID=6549 RepID=UPI0022476C90|nr:uncharacterized protein LOC127736654 [Mytilus californianus]
MASSEVCTPRKISVRTKSCVFCGFSFIQIEISSSSRNWFLSKRRCRQGNGVYIKYFRKVQQSMKLKKMQEELVASWLKIQQTILNLPSPRKFQTEKRMLRSPASTQSSKQMKIFPVQSLRPYAVYQVLNPV